MDALKSVLSLDLLTGWRTHLAIVSFLIANALESIGIDVPQFTFVDWVQAFELILVAYGLRGAALRRD